MVVGGFVCLTTFKTLLRAASATDPQWYAAYAALAALVVAAVAKVATRTKTARRGARVRRN